MIVLLVAWIVSGADEDAAVTVVEHAIISDHRSAGGVPSVDSPARVAVNDVFQCVTAQVRVIDALDAPTRVLIITHIVHYVADHIVVPAGGVAIDYARPAVFAATPSRDVVNIVPDDSDVGTTVIDAHISVASNIAALDISISASLIPDTRVPFLDQ